MSLTDSPSLLALLLRLVLRPQILRRDEPSRTAAFSGPKIDFILLYHPEPMKNIVIGVLLCNYAFLAAPCSFGLLFKRRVSLAFPFPE